MSDRKKELPQGGTGRSATGESSSTAPDLPGVGCPTSSGGDTTSIQEQYREMMTRRVEAYEELEALKAIEMEAQLDSERTGSSLSIRSEDSLGLARGSTSPPKKHRKRRIVEKRRELDSDDDDEVDLVEVSSAGSRTGRVRGGMRTATPGSRMETEVSASEAEAESSGSGALAAIRATEDDHMLGSDELGTKVGNSARQVLEAVKKSRNLKGTIVREIKSAVYAICSAADVLKARSGPNSEEDSLRREVQKLRAELHTVQEMKRAMLKEAVEERKKFRELRMASQSSAALADELAALKAEREGWERQTRESVQKLEELKQLNALDRRALQKALQEVERLKTAAELPAVVVGGTAAAAPGGTPPRVLREDAEDRIIRRVGEMMESRFAEMEERISAKGRRPPKVKSVPTAGSSGPGTNRAPQREPSGGRAPQPSTSATNAEGWSTVVRRGKRKGAGASQAAPAKTQPAKGPRGGQTAEEPQRSKKRRKVKARPPRSSAVVLTMTPGAEARGVTYRSVLTEAKAKISLVPLGITDLRFRVGRTGARILEIPGTNTGEAADALAAKIEEVLHEDVRVTRPVKSAELRIVDLDDSVSVADVVVAVIREGECRESAVKTGEIRRNAQGTGSIWVRCPVVAAKKLVEAGRLRIGWMVARVQSLDPRPQRCYRCLLTGHWSSAQCENGGVRRGCEETTSIKNLWRSARLSTRRTSSGRGAPADDGVDAA
ncbi:uncharacterized protein LOC131854545 [Achroia grisella]|uniref:uncharacterized protein LOC131854545 n=1 Tax=Achroia grisella TaxID=688607 RepID=UPI0027D1FF8F|nr:uncharacterized protein LOC131854545 [Achroia grisella]